MCAKCRHPVEHVAHVHDAKGDWLDVTCHGTTMRLADGGNEGLPLLAFTQ